MDIERILPITHKYGLHARASTKFVEVAQRFKSSISIAKGEGDAVDGKSVLALLTLGAQLGDEIVLRIAGPDAEKALEALTDLVKADFHGV